MSKLNFLNGWTGVSKYFSRHSAQSYMGTNQLAFAASNGGSSCGSDDDSKPQPSACGAGDDEKQNPPASACGAGDDTPQTQKPSSCGSGCGAGDGK